MANSVLGLTLTANTAAFSANMMKATRAMSTVGYLGDKLGNKFKKDGAGFESAARATGIAGGTALIAGMGIAMTGNALMQSFTKPMLEAANKAETAMRNAMFLANADSGSALEKRISDTVRRVATTSTISITEGYDTIGAIIQSGIDASIAPDLLSSVVQYSEASFGKTDVKGAVALLTTGLQKFNVEGDTAAQKMQNLGNILTATKKHTAFDDKSIKSYFQALGAAPKLNKATSVQEWMVLGGMLKGTGKTARRVGQNMNSLTAGTIKFQTALANIKASSVGKQTKAAAKEMGLDFNDFIDEKGQMKSMIEVIGLITEGAKKAAKKDGRKAQDVMADVYTKLFGGIKVTPEITKLFNEMVVLSSEKNFKGFDAFAMKLKAVTEETNAMGLASDINRKTWAGTAKIIEGIMESINTIIGQEMKEILSGSLTKIKEVFEKVSAALVNNKGLRKSIAYFMLLAPIFMVIAGTFMSMIGLAMLIAPALIAVVAEIAAAGATILIPIMAILAAFLAAGAVLAYIVGNNVGGMADWIQKKFTLLKWTIKGIIDFWDGWGSTDNEMMLRKLGIWELIKSIYMLKERLKAMWIGVKKGFEGSGLTSMFTKLSEDIQGFFEKAFGGNGKFARSDMRRWEKYGMQLSKVLKVIGYGVYFIVVGIWMIVQVMGIFIAALKAAYDFINKYETAFQAAATVMAIGLLGVAIVIGVVLFLLGAILIIIGFIGLAIFFMASYWLAMIGLIIAIGYFLHKLHQQIVMIGVGLVMLLVEALRPAGDFLLTIVKTIDSLIAKILVATSLMSNMGGGVFQWAFGGGTNSVANPAQDWQTLPGAREMNMPAGAKASKSNVNNYEIHVVSTDGDPNAQAGAIYEALTKKKTGEGWMDKYWD